MIKIIYFDVGRVLIKTVSGMAHKEAARILRASPDAVEETFHRNLTKVAEGKLSEVGFWKLVGRRFRASNTQVNKLLPIFKKRRVRIQRRTLAVAKKLKRNGYRIGIISDVIPSHEKIIRETGLYRNFSPVLLSCKTGISKRKTGAYRLAVRRASVRPSEIVFFDDHKEFVAKARELGIKTFVYKNPAQLARSLRKLGIRI